jgi:hypothetical protein
LSLKFGSLSANDESIIQASSKAESNPPLPETPAPSQQSQEVSSATDLEEKSASDQSVQPKTTSSQPQSEIKPPSNLTNQGPLSAYANFQQPQAHYQQPGILAMPQGPIPNDFGANILYNLDPQRAQFAAYYDSISQASNLQNASQASKDETNNAQPSNISSNISSSASISSNPQPNAQGLYQHPQQFQPSSFQGLAGFPYYSPFYYNMGMLQHANQFQNHNLSSNYNQQYAKQGMFPVFPNNIPAVNMQQLQQLSMLQQQAQMNQTQQQQQQQTSQSAQPSQQAKASKPPAVAGSNSSQHVGMNPQRVVSNSAGNQYGVYNPSQAPNNHINPSNAQQFDQDSSSTQSAHQQYGFGNSQLPAFFNPSNKVSPVSATSVGQNQAPKDVSSTSGKSIGPGLNQNQPAAVIGGTTFYNSSQQPVYSNQIPAANYPAIYSQSNQQMQSPQQLYSAYNQAQQQPLSAQPHGHSQPQVSSQAQSQQAQQPQSYSQQPQFHHPNSQQPQPGSYHSYNQLRANQPYWSGQN